MLNSLSLRYLERHPDNAARDIERLNSDDQASLIGNIPASIAANILTNITPVHGVQLLSLLEIATSISILELMPANIAATITRRLPARLCAALLKQAADEEQLESVRLLVKFPANTVGAIMDPQILVLQKSLNIDEVKRVLQCHEKELPHEFYVVDERYKLRGYVAACDLLLKDQLENISALLKPCAHSIFSRLRIESAVENPGWLENTQLPVVDNEGVLLGELDKHVLQTALTQIELRGTDSDPSRDILVGLAETFLNSFSEIMSGNRRQKSGQ